MKLLEPGQIGKLKTRNRIVMSAMGIGALAEPDGRVSERLIDFYEARARGGVGLIITSAALVTRDIEQPPNGFFGLTLMADQETYITRFCQLAEAVHDHGARLCVQLFTGFGHNAPPRVLKETDAVGPSPNPTYFNPEIKQRELTIDEIERLVRSFENAARIVRAAGADAIELNCHGGYLFDEFTTALWNHRSDQYGGSVEGRLRFSLEVIQAIKSGAGGDFPLSVRFALTHYTPGGRDEEEGLEIARRWEKAGINALNIDAGCNEARYWANPPTTQPMGCMVDLAARVKSVVKIPVIAVGKLGDPRLAEKVLQDGKADFIALARPLLADPEWANKVKEARFDDICPCVGDHEGCHRRLYERKLLSCSVNPACGMEKDLAITPAPRKKSVLVIGGGPAGLEAARVAALRGHNVTLWEKSDLLGGNLLPAAVPDFKQEYRTLISYLTTQIRKLGVNIKTLTEANPAKVQALRPEFVFVATGAAPIIPGIPGVDCACVATAPDLLMGRKTAGRTMLIIGGGMVGCEAALHFARQGKKVTVIEILKTVMGDLYYPNRQHLEHLLAEAGVRILTETCIREISDIGVTVSGTDGTETSLPADTIALAVGLKADDRLFQELVPIMPEVRAIGDCAGPRRLLNAVWEGYRVARLV